MIINHNLQSKARYGWKLLTLVVLISLLMSGCGSEKPKVYRVGVLSGLDFVADITDGFKAKMAELGYVEGENITYDVQKTNVDFAAYKSILKKFLEDDVDLILVFPTEATQEAKAATQGTDIPVVFTFANIEDTGIVDSVREPGGNITGVRYPGPDVALKRFEVLQQMVPNAKRMIVPYLKDYPIVKSQLEVLYPAAEAAGVTLVEVPAASPPDLQAALDALVQGDDPGGDAILMIVEPLAVTPDFFLILGKFADEHKLPMGGVLMGAGGYGTIFGINPSSYEIGKQAAPLADKVLKGTSAGTIPVLSAEPLLAINYKLAQAMGLDVPESLLSQANQVVR